MQFEISGRLNGSEAMLLALYQIRRSWLPRAVTLYFFLILISLFLNGVDNHSGQPVSRYILTTDVPITYVYWTVFGGCWVIALLGARAQATDSTITINPDETSIVIGDAAKITFNTDKISFSETKFGFFATHKTIVLFFLPYRVLSPTDRDTIRAIINPPA